MRSALLFLVLASAACAHGRSTNSADARPQPDLVPAAQLFLPDRIETISVFEVRPGVTEADRFVGDVSRQALLARFDDMRNTACIRTVHLVLVAYAPGGHATEEITYGGILPRLRFFYGRQRLDGVEIPC